MKNIITPGKILAKGIIIKDIASINFKLWEERRKRKDIRRRTAHDSSKFSFFSQKISQTVPNKSRSSNN